MGTETNKDERNTPEYLAQLLKDKKQIQAFPNVFIHLEKLLDEGKFTWSLKMQFSWLFLATKFAEFAMDNAECIYWLNTDGKCVGIHSCVCYVLMVHRTWAWPSTGGEQVDEKFLD